jgi:hypothetical protein
VKFLSKWLKGLSTAPTVLSTPDQIGVVAIVAQVPRVLWALAGDQP